MHILAIDFGGTRTRAAWFDAGMQLIARQEQPSQVSDPIEAVLSRICATAQAVVPAGMTPDAIGIAAPGPLDAASGVILHADTLPGWQNVALAAHVSKAFGDVPAFMQNDANLAALAESQVGSDGKHDPLIYLTLSTGIGGGAVIGGRLFTGAEGLAIEPGHMRFTLPDGCIYKLEDLASGTALGKRAIERLESSMEASVLREINVVDGAAVGRAAAANDPLALDVVGEAGYWLGLGLANLVHLFNPAAIVLGGSVTALGDLLLEPVKDALRANILTPNFYHPDLLRLASLGDNVCLHGAAYYARQRAADRS